MYGSDPPPAPVTNNYEESMREALQAQIDLAPDLYRAEMGQRYDPNTQSIINVGGGRADYARLEAGLRREALTGKDGIASLLGGDQKTVFAGESGYRKAGFDQMGNFMGAASLEQDLQQRQKRRQVTQEIELAKDNQAKLTQALRGGLKSGLSRALDTFTTKATESSNVEDIAKIGAMAGNYGQVAGAAQTVFDNRIDTDQYAGEDNKIDSTALFARSQGKLDVKEQAKGNFLLSEPLLLEGDQVKEIKDTPNVEVGQIGDLGTLRSNLTREAKEDLRFGGDLSGDERRQIEEDARAAATARGRSRDTATIVDEVANLESARRARRNERRQFAQSVAGQEAALVESDLNRQLQADSINQEVDLKSQLANQNVDFQRILQNQRINMDAQKLNQATKLQRDLANQQANLRAQESTTKNLLSALQMDLQGQGMEADRQAQINALRQAGDVANLQQVMDMTRMGISARSADIDRNIAIDQINQANQMQALAQDRAALQNLINAEQATSADAFMALTGRPSGQTMTAGQSAFGNTSSALGAAPTLYNPAQGAQFDANQAAMLNSYNAATYGAQQARSGSIIGGIAGGLGMLGGGYLSSL